MISAVISALGSAIAQRCQAFDILKSGSGWHPHLLPPVCRNSDD
jgi:hypothetical protein